MPQAPSASSTAPTHPRRQIVFASQCPCRCQRFCLVVDGDAAHTVTPQNVLDHINDDTVCLACHHNYATHSAEPAFNCALCPPGSCTRFSLKTANEFVFNCVCSCEHAYSFHELGPAPPSSSLQASQAQPPATTPAPAIARPPPAQLSATPSSTSLTAPARLAIVPFPELLPSANTAGLTTNQQRTRSAERHGAAARANGGLIARGPVGSRVPPAPAAPHVPPRAAAAPYPDSSIRASNAGAAPSTSAVTRRPVGRPPGKTKIKRLVSRIIILPYDVCTDFSPAPDHPSVRSLQLPSNFNRLKLHPSSYSVFVRHLDECHLVIRIDLSGEDLEPPNFYHRVHAIVKEHLDRHNLVLQTYGNPLPARALWRSVNPRKQGEERTFVYLDLEDVSFTISQFTPANRSINSTADLYLGKFSALLMLAILIPLSTQFPIHFLIIHHGSSVVRFLLHSSPTSTSLSPRSTCLTTASLSVPSNTPPLHPPTAHLDVPGAQPSAAPFQPL
ncbi:hypothetical protein AURDEDRAFT_168026 [Auricularia subglabra TFB-10046 SS5]|nr:hypothetical protein AURDEDRAFT_168026 [Auricularia subglabra TFB-10046 SS5]